MGRARNRKKLTRGARGRQRTSHAASSRAVALNMADVAVAHHEAAHAVAGTLLGITQQYTELIVQDGGVKGYTSTAHPKWFQDWADSRAANPLDDEQRAYLHAYMVTTLAGALADRQFRSDGLEPDNDQDPRSDVGQVSTILWTLVGGDDDDAVPVQQAMDALVEETAALMEKHWPQVEVVAAELAQRRRLTGSEVGALLDSGARVEWLQQEQEVAPS